MGLDRVRRWILAPASWLALGYCGYWLALALDRVAVAVLVGPWAGSRVLAWRVTPFGVTIATSGYRTIPSAAIFSTLPLLLLLLLIAVMALAGHRVRPLFVRVAIEFAALWAALLILLEWTLVGRAPGPLIRRFIPPRFIWGISQPLWILLTIGLSLALLVSARPIARQLIEAARATWKRTPLAIALLLIWLSMILVLAGAFDVYSAVRFLGARSLVWLALPGGACLLLILAGLTVQRRGDASVTAPWPRPQPLASVLAGFVLLAGLLNSQMLRRWYGERTMSRVDAAHYEVLSPPGAFTAAQLNDFVAARETLLEDMAAKLHTSPGKDATPRDSLSGFSIHGGGYGRDARLQREWNYRSRGAGRIGRASGPGGRRGGAASRTVGRAVRASAWTNGPRAGLRESGKAATFPMRRRCSIATPAIGRSLNFWTRSLTA